MDIFKPLEKYTWKAEGNWGDGSKFKQEIELSFSLQGNLVEVESMGFTNSEQTEFGMRNHGVRQFDKESGAIRFWEFDVFGGVTKGTVKGEDRNLVYVYEYGGATVTEMWIYKDPKTYTYIVGMHENGKWSQKFLETEFKGFKK